MKRLTAWWRRQSRRTKAITVLAALVMLVAIATSGHGSAPVGVATATASPEPASTLADATAQPPAVTATPESASTPGGKSAEDYVRQYGGLTGVYRSILAETDCAKLGNLFVTANDNHKLGFVVATNDRMRAIGCG